MFDFLSPFFSASKRVFWLRRASVRRWYAIAKLLLLDVFGRWLRVLRVRCPIHAFSQPPREGVERANNTRESAQLMWTSERHFSWTTSPMWPYSKASSDFSIPSSYLWQTSDQTSHDKQVSACTYSRLFPPQNELPGPAQSGGTLQLFIRALGRSSISGVPYVTSTSYISFIPRHPSQLTPTPTPPPYPIPHTATRPPTKPPQTPPLPRPQPPTPPTASYPTPPPAPARSPSSPASDASPAIPTAFYQFLQHASPGGRWYGYGFEYR